MDRVLHNEGVMTISQLIIDSLSLIFNDKEQI